LVVVPVVVGVAVPAVVVVVVPAVVVVVVPAVVGVAVLVLVALTSLTLLILPATPVKLVALSNTTVGVAVVAFSRDVIVLLESVALVAVTVTDVPVVFSVEMGTPLVIFTIFAAVE
jgi:hypothetical protein